MAVRGSALSAWCLHDGPAMGLRWVAGPGDEGAPSGGTSKLVRTKQSSASSQAASNRDRLDPAHSTRGPHALKRTSAQSAPGGSTKKDRAWGVAARLGRPLSVPSRTRNDHGRGRSGTVRGSIRVENRTFASTPDAQAKPRIVVRCHSSGRISETVLAFRSPWLSTLLCSIPRRAGSASEEESVDIGRVAAIKGTS